MVVGIWVRSAQGLGFRGVARVETIRYKLYDPNHARHTCHSARRSALLQELEPLGAEYPSPKRINLFNYGRIINISKVH